MNSSSTLIKARIAGLMLVAPAVHARAVDRSNRSPRSAQCRAITVAALDDAVIKEVISVRSSRDAGQRVDRAGLPTSSSDRMPADARTSARARAWTTSAPSRSTSANR